MIHRTETGPYKSANLHARGGSSISQSIINNLNKPLPWCCIATATAFLSLGLVLSASSQISNNAINQAALIKNANDRAYDAQTQSLLLRDYVDKMRFEMASHGIKPPDYPAELKR